MNRFFSYSEKNIIFYLFTIIALNVIAYFISKLNNVVNPQLAMNLVGIELGLLFSSIVFFKIYMRYIKGSNGEFDVRNILEKLPEGYYFLHDIQLPNNKMNIDFAVFGKTGIWTIEVKNYRKREIKMDYFLKKNIWQAKKEAEILRTNINMSVNPVLVFTNKKTKLHFGMVPQDGVYVIGISWLEELLTRMQKGYLSKDQAFQVKESLKNYTSKI